jgi:hypothetical protein
LHSRDWAVVSENPRHEPFCTVLPEQMSESMSSVEIEDG